MRVLYVTLFVLATDQVTKFLVKGLKIGWLGINLQGMPYGTSKELAGKYVRLTFIENPGMAFGIDASPKMFLTLFTIIASFIILYYIYKHRKDGLLIRLSLAFILAGALGNLIDRTFYGMIYHYAPFFYGRVVDFVQVEFWSFTFLGRTYSSWPIFNVADVSVTIGFLIIIIFHKKIFKPVEQVPVLPEVSAQGIISNEIKNDSVPVSILTDNGIPKVEDRKENSDQNTAGAG